MINQISTATPPGFRGKPASKPFEHDQDGLAALFCLPLTPPVDAPAPAPRDSQPAEISAILPEAQVLGSTTSDSPLLDTINGSQKVIPAMDEVLPDAQAQTPTSEARNADLIQDETFRQFTEQTQTRGEAANLGVADPTSARSLISLRGQFAQVTAGQKTSPKFSDANLEVGNSHVDETPAKVSDDGAFINNIGPNFTELVESKIGGQFKQILSVAGDIAVSGKPEASQKDTGSYSPENIAINPSEQTGLAARETPQAAAGTSDLSKAVAAQVEPHVIALAGSMQMSGEKRMMKMRLHPAELGNVEITLEKNSSGTISARFQTESEQTRQILSQGLEHLRSALERAGFQVAELNISHDASLAAGGDAQKNSPQNFGRAEQRSAPDDGPDGALTHDDGHNVRLVNLRA
ncbi:MAG: flagellar hook-length control protein FliK [Acidobacteriota bacterium]